MFGVEGRLNFGFSSAGPLLDFGLSDQEVQLTNRAYSFPQSKIGNPKSKMGSGDRSCNHTLSERGRAATKGKKNFSAKHVLSLVEGNAKDAKNRTRNISRKACPEPRRRDAKTLSTENHFPGAESRV